MVMASEDIKHEVRKLHLGKKIRDLRKKAGLVLQDLSDRTGLSKPLLSQIEQELVSPPIATLLKISKALQVNISFFFQDGNPEEKVVVVKKTIKVRHRIIPHDTHPLPNCRISVNEPVPS